MSDSPKSTYGSAENSRTSTLTNDAADGARASSGTSAHTDPQVSNHVSITNSHNSRHNHSNDDPGDLLSVSVDVHRSIKTITRSVQLLATAANLPIDTIPSTPASSGLSNTYKTWIAGIRKEFQVYLTRARAFLDVPDVPRGDLRRLVTELHRTLTDENRQLELLLAHLQKKQKQQTIAFLFHYWSAFANPVKDVLGKLVQGQRASTPNSTNAIAPSALPPPVAVTTPGEVPDAALHRAGSPIRSPSSQLRADRDRLDQMLKEAEEARDQLEQERREWLKHRDEAHRHLQQELQQVQATRPRQADALSRAVQQLSLTHQQQPVRAQARTEANPLPREQGHSHHRPRRPPEVRRPNTRRPSMDEASSAQPLTISGRLREMAGYDNFRAPPERRRGHSRRQPPLRESFIHDYQPPELNSTPLLFDPSRPPPQRRRQSPQRELSPRRATHPQLHPPGGPTGGGPPPGRPFPLPRTQENNPTGKGVFTAYARQRYAHYLQPQDQEVFNPFHSTDQAVDPDFFRQLHYPWNTVPAPTSTRITDFRKLEGLAPKFRGEPAMYATWRAMFIHNIHLTNTDTNWKATVLMNCLDNTCPRLQDIIAGLDPSPAAYARAITRLERAFGHPLGLKGQRKRELDQISFVREHDFRTLEKFYYKLDDYIQQLEGLDRGREALEDNFFEELFVKLDRRLARAFQTWHASHYPQNAYTAFTLLAWLEELLQQHQAADRAHSNKPRRPPPPDPQRAQRGHLTQDAPSAERVVPHPAATVATANVPQQAFPTHSTAQQTCPFDGQHHRIVTCPEFQAMTPQTRRKQLRQRRRCYACFEEGHRIRDCTRGILCSLCNKNHHTLLHNSRPATNAQDQTTSAAPTHRPPGQRVLAAREETDSGGESDWSCASQEVYCSKTSALPKKISLQTLPTTCINPQSGAQVQLNCMLDTGATGAFLSRRAATELGLTGRTCTTKITGFNGATTHQHVMIAHIKLTAPGSPVFHITVQVTEDPAASYQPFNWLPVKSHFPHLADLPLLPPVPDKPVDLMLGQDTPHLIRALEPDRFVSSAAPVARRTALGWAVGGPTGETTTVEDGRAFHVLKAGAAWQPVQLERSAHSPPSYVFTAEKTVQTNTKQPQVKERQEKGLTEAVLRMFDVDDAAGKPAVSVQDERLFQHLRAEMTQIDGRYQLPVLWKENPPQLVNNYAIATARLRSLEKSLLAKGQQHYTSYFDQLRGWLEALFVEVVNTDTPQVDTAYYLPHFAVYRPDKISSQIRTVMDAAARCNGQPSLNDKVYKGPKLINELVSVLLRFRRLQITVAADIKKMFHKLQMPPHDRDFHRFLWRSSPTEPVKIYRWRSHVFGNAGSPCVAIFAIKEHARKQKLRFPAAADTVIFSTLVDDAMDSCETAQEAEQLLHQLRQMLAQMNMNIKKVVSNSAAVMDSVPPHERSPSLSIATICQKEEAFPLVKALGVIYLPDEDAFTFTMTPPSDIVTWTKRLMLKFQARLYDPHGVILPHTIQARMILQEVWRAGIDWDQAIPLALQEKWQEWLEHLQALPLLRIPRCLFNISHGTPKDRQYHVFCDASAAGYAAVAYHVGNSPPNHREARLVLAKGRVAPLRQISIPRLELLAAELALDVGGALSDALAVPLTSIHFWSDSTNVLCWVRNDSRVLTSFVGTRVAKIQHHTSLDHWRWVPGDLNPADLPSRGLGAGDLAITPLWWEGPPFLVDETRSPVQPDVLQASETAIKEVKKGAQFAFIHQPLQQIPTWNKKDGISPDSTFPVDVTRFSSWTRLVRVVAWCKRAFHTAVRGALRPPELREAERLLLGAAQEDAFSQTLTELRTTGRLLPRSRSALRQVHPALHPDGLFRSHARLRYLQEMPYEQRHPIILPKAHKVTELIIQYTHRLLLHAGVSITLTHLLRKYWLVQGRRQVRSVITSCLVCRRQSPRPLQQIMAPLPHFRVPQGNHPAPFDNIGVDMAGPFTISNDRRITMNKRYFLLITCTTTRAIHLEPLASASTPAFLMAYERFLARRRGQDHPTSAICDNGTNITGGMRELSQLWKKEDKALLQKRYASTTWKFVPPLASHYGGVYERLIAAVKKSLYHALPQETPFSDEEFHTALVEVEGILNSRPLSYVPTEPDAPRPLTPADALGVPPYRQIAPPPAGGWKYQKRWHFLQARLDAFWRRFVTEVVPYLQLMHKWNSTARNLQKGDVVLLLDNQCRGRWPLARVEAVEESSDGHVRAALIRVPASPRPVLRRRPITQLSLLLPNTTDSVHTE